MSFKHNAVGREAIEGLRFLTSLPRAGAGARKRNLLIGSIPVCLLRYALSLTTVIIGYYDYLGKIHQV